MPPPTTFWTKTKALLLTLYSELFRTRMFTVAAALAFYFLLAFIPLLLLLGSLLAYLPLPNLFGQLLVLLSRLVPKDAMGLVFQVMNTLLAPDKSKIITIGIVGTVWAASGGFSACIDALNIAYDAELSRPWWRDRVQAIVLTLTSGALAVVSLVAMILGPEFGHVLEHFFGISISFARLWPLIQFGVTFLTFVFAVMLLYILAPTVHQRLRSTLPGAVFAVVIFFAGSAGLRFYVGHLTNTSRTYGALGAVVALMLWLYLMAIALLLGAELNAEMVKQAGIRLPGMRKMQAGPTLPTFAISMPRTALAAAESASGVTAHPMPPPYAIPETAAISETCLSTDLAAKDGLAQPEHEVTPTGQKG